MLEKLNALSIRQRMNAISFIAIGGFALILLAVVGTNLTIRSAATRMQNASEVLQTVQQLETDAVQLRRHEKDFLMRREEKAATAHAASVKATQDEIAKLETLVTDEKLAGEIAAVKGFLADYDKQWQTVTGLQRELGLTEEEGLQGKLRTAVHDAEDRLKAANNDKLTILMLMMRRHEKDFMLRGKDKYIDELHDKLGKFKAQASGQTLSDIDTYGSAFDEWSSKQVKMNAEVKTLSEIYAKMPDHLAAVATGANEAFHSAESSLGRAVTLGIFVGLAIVAGAGILVWQLSRRIGNSIVEPLEGLTQTVVTIGAGNYEVSVPHTDLTDSIGAMAKEVDKLRIAAAERERMQEEAIERERHEMEERERLAEEERARTRAGSRGSRPPGGRSGSPSGTRPGIPGQIRRGDRGTFRLGQDPGTDRRRDGRHRDPHG